MPAGDSSGGWDTSAAAWIADMGEHGDFGRQHVLDAPMLARVRNRGFRHALDVGCGEGRFCRKLAELGLKTTGIDPTVAFITTAVARHPEGDYRIGVGEKLDMADASFDLVISYLSLIDIADLAAAIAEMVRVLAPGGTLLIANLTGFKTAQAGSPGQDYGDEWASWEEWRGIRVQNWHRPLNRYMTLLLAQGLVLRHFDEPNPTGGEPAKAARYRRLPWYLIMEWQKPAA